VVLVKFGLSNLNVQVPKLQLTNAPSSLDGESTFVITQMMLV
jgi:hypothetical protein